MMNRTTGLLLAGICAAILLPAQQGDRRGGEQTRIPTFDQTAVERGQRIFAAQCGFCHGANAKGGESGPDLIRSIIVLDEENGAGLGQFLKAGRPDLGMPRFDLPAGQVSDIATFLHQRVTDAEFRQTYKVLNILVGDPKAGVAYFNGAGGCTSCHSPAGDLKAIGAKYDAETLQNRIVMPRARRAPPEESGRAAVTATVTTESGATYTGVLIRLTDFDITIREAAGAVRTFIRTDESNPRIERRDALQGHWDQLPKWTDTDLHNVTAYLTTLK
jgi:mono/diheme cytochrome c family protein